jgi:coat protein Gp5
MANTFITPQWVTTDTATGFLDSTKLIGRFDRQWDDSFFNKPGGAQIGDTVQVRIEQRWTATEGQALQQQAILNQTVPITVNHQFNVGMGWSSAQATLEVEEVQSRYTRPAGKRLAAKWDRVAGAEVYKSVYFAVGTPGTNVSLNTTWGDAVALLQEQGVPDEFIAVVSPSQQNTLTGANQAMFNPTQFIGEMFKSGKFGGAALGMREWYFDPLLPTHTTGTYTASTILTDSAGQTGSTLTTDGWGTYALRAGDIFTVDGVYSTNPLEQDLNMGRLQQFTLSADQSGSTTATLAFTPAIVTSGALQNVTAAPANNAAITFLGSTGAVAGTLAATITRQNLIFHPSAFAFVMVDLDRDLPGADSGYTSDKETRVKMRWARQWSVQTDQKASRIDTMGGVAAILPYFAVRAFGQG